MPDMEQETVGYKYRAAPGMAMTGNRDNDTPVQPQSERDKYLAVRSRRRQWGQPISRDPAGGERPVELIRCQPFDERPQRFGVSGTKGISLHRRYIPRLKFAQWLCRCDCGEKCLASTHQLSGGYKKSCGCLQRNVVSDNLRLVDGTSVTVLEAMRKRTLSSNTSGHTGVYWNAKSQKWAAQITFKKKTYYLGSFEKIEDAIKARKRGEVMHDDFLDWYYQLHPRKAPEQETSKMSE